MPVGCSGHFQREWKRHAEEEVVNDRTWWNDGKSNSGIVARLPPGAGKERWTKANDHARCPSFFVVFTEREWNFPPDIPDPPVDISSYSISLPEWNRRREEKARLCVLKYVRAGVDAYKFTRNNATVLTSLMCDCSRPFWSVSSRTTTRFCLSASRSWRSRLSSTACKSRRSACSSWHRCSHSARAWASCRRNRCRSCSISCKWQMTPDRIQWRSYPRSKRGNTPRLQSSGGRRWSPWITFRLLFANKWWAKKKTKLSIVCWYSDTLFYLVLLLL